MPAENTGQNTMQVISFSGLNGGVGRTTTLLSLVPVWLAAGQRVVILNATCRNTMAAWETTMTRLNVRAPDLKVVNVADDDDLQALVYDCRKAGFDKVLVDLPVRPSSLMFQAFGVSDLLVVCLRDTEQAIETSLFLSEHADAFRLAVGLVVETSPGEDYSYGMTRRAFTVGPCFVNEAKYIPVLRAMFDFPICKKKVSPYADWLTALVPYQFGQGTRQTVAATDRQRAEFWSLVRIAAEIEAVIEGEALKKKNEAIEYTMGFDTLVNRETRIRRGDS